MRPERFNDSSPNQLSPRIPGDAGWLYAREGAVTAISIMKTAANDHGLIVRFIPGVVGIQTRHRYDGRQVTWCSLLTSTRGHRNGMPEWPSHRLELSRSGFHATRPMAELPRLSARRGKARNQATAALRQDTSLSVINFVNSNVDSATDAAG